MNTENIALWAAIIVLFAVMLPLFFRAGMVMLGTLLELWGIQNNLADE